MQKRPEPERLVGPVLNRRMKSVALTIAGRCSATQWISFTENFYMRDLTHTNTHNAAYAKQTALTHFTHTRLTPARTQPTGLRVIKFSRTRLSGSDRTALTHTENICRRRAKFQRETCNSAEQRMDLEI